jgi:hypothetical protein
MRRIQCWAQPMESAAFMARQLRRPQWRYLQPLTEIGVEKDTTMVFPLPMEPTNLLNRTFTPNPDLAKKT